MLYFINLSLLFLMVKGEIWKLKETHTDASIQFITSSVNPLIVGFIKHCTSVIQCLARCNEDDQYSSFYFSSMEQRCFCNTQLDGGVNITSQDTGVVYGVKNLHYERTHYLSFQRMHIVPEKRDCLSYYQQGFHTDGVYLISPVSGLPVEAWCDMTGGGWTVIQRRQDGSEDFYRGWDDYVKGFGNRTGEYWLGLDNIHIMSQENSSLRIELAPFSDRLPKTAFAQYSRFQIGSSLANYVLAIGGYFGDCGDSMAYQNSMPFTTLDRKNDPNSVNCAVKFKGAWWHKTCHYSNLNGLYLGPGTTTFGEGMNWYHCWGHNYSVKKSVMKIRRNIV